MVGLIPIGYRPGIMESNQCRRHYENTKYVSTDIGSIIGLFLFITEFTFDTRQFRTCPDTIRTCHRQ